MRVRRYLIHKRLLPALGEKHVRDITAADVQRALDSWNRDALAPNTMRSYYNVLRRLFCDAARARLIRENPCAGILPPPRIEGSFFHWTDESLAAQIAALERSSVRDLGLLLIGSALRPVEMYHARAADYGGGRLLVSYAGRYVVEPRRIDLPAFASAAAERLVEQSRAFGSTYLFSSASGEPLSGGDNNRQYRIALREAGPCPSNKCMDLRRAFEHLCTKAGVPTQVRNYYMMMRAPVRPADAELQRASELLDTAFNTITARPSRS